MERTCSRPFSLWERERERVRACRALLLTTTLLAHCTCNQHPPNANADGDTEADVDADAGADTDSDIDFDAIGDRDPDPDIDIVDTTDFDDSDFGTIDELCGDNLPELTWHPSECPEYMQPPDCCASCRPLTCRDSHYIYNIWENLVVYQQRSSIFLLDLNTGVDSLFLESHREGGYQHTYDRAAISSRHVILRKMLTDLTTYELTQQVVVVPLDDLSRREIVLDTHDSIGYPQIYGDWACWGRDREDGIRELALMNIETREERVLDDESGGAMFFGGDVWDDRVVWAMGFGVLKEHRISTGVTRTVISNPELGPVLVSVWDHYAVFRNERSGSPYNVFLVDLETNEYRSISPSLFEQDQPEIYDGRVVWTDLRWGTHILIYSIRTGRQYELNPSAIHGSEPRIFDRTVLWQGQTAGAPGGIWVTRIGDI
jgi:hypothetical protein